MKKKPLKTLKSRRKALGVTQRILADRLGVTPQFYSELERGLNVLSYRNALIIANMLDTTTDELFKDEFNQLDKENIAREWEKFHQKGY